MLLHSHYLTCRNTFRYFKSTWTSTSAELSATQTLKKNKNPVVNHQPHLSRGPWTRSADEPSSWMPRIMTKIENELLFYLSHQKPTLRGWRNAQITSNASSVSTNSQQLTNWFELFLSEQGRRTCRLGSRGVLGWWGRVRRVLGGCQELIRECEGWGEAAKWALRPETNVRYISARFIITSFPLDKEYILSKQ